VKLPADPAVQVANPVWVIAAAVDDDATWGTSTHMTVMGETVFGS